MSTLNKLVRDQILAEGPQIVEPILRDHYINEQLRCMSRADFLERISDALLRYNAMNERCWL